MKISFFLFVILLAFSQNILHAAIIEEVSSGETLDMFAERTIKYQQLKYQNNLLGFKKDIIKWNPFITDWNNLTSGTKLYIEYPFPAYVPHSEFVIKPATTTYLSEEDQKFSMFGFFTSTFGNYEESTTSQVVKSGQNFPITLGLGSTFSNKNRQHFISTSLYWAKPTKGNISGNSNAGNNSITIPGETGFNLYYQYFVSSIQTFFYSGFDYENLNTFNTDQIILGQSVVNISNKMNYATLGANIKVEQPGYTFNTKLSISDVISSSSSGTKALTGYKYLVYLSFRPDGRISYNLMYKHHELKGPTDLSINRFGVSLGYQFF